MSGHFEVNEIIEFRQNRTLIARYRPGFPYRFTDVNRGFVGGLIADGRAQEASGERVATMRNALGTSPSHISGAVTVG